MLLVLCLLNIDLYFSQQLGAQFFSGGLVDSSL